jgi:hypothetical protein
MRFLASLMLVCLILGANAQTSNNIICKLDSVYSTDMDSYVSVVIYEPEYRIQNGEVTPILYIFGDVLFESFSGSINYLHNELQLIPNSILIGINEIQHKHFGAFQEEYASFISNELMDQLSSKYNLNSNGILYGHSRASRLVGKVIQKNPKQINGFILSAPWFTSEQLMELERSFSSKSEMISIYYSLSEEDIEKPQIREAKNGFSSLLNKHENIVRSEYHFFDNETHMSIPPLSFYYGVKYLLQ